METYSFKLPDLGEGIVESEVSAWHVAVGDLVQEDQPLADVQTDKAIVEVTSPVTGEVIALGCEAGEVLAVGAELISFSLATAGGTEPAVEQPAPAAEKAGTAKLETPSSPGGSAATRSHQPPAGDQVFRRVLASPSLRRRAREAGVDLGAVPGSGPGGRISHRDFDACLGGGGQLAAPPGPGDRRTGETAEKITGLRRVIARKMQQAKRDIPHYSYIEEVDVTQLEVLRCHLNAERDERQPKLTLLPFFIQALVKVLPGFPHCNAHFDDESGVLTRFDAVHVGVATMTGAGLMVPVVKHCESLDLWQSAEAVSALSAAAREGKATPAQLSNSTITITSLGAIGGIATTPVINAPETSIIGINRMQQRPVVREGDIVVRTMMNISASFDHRIVDGYDGARLVQALKLKLENPGAIFV